jgi:hypothetical protein
MGDFDGVISVCFALPSYSIQGKEMEMGSLVSVWLLALTMVPASEGCCFIGVLWNAWWAAHWDGRQDCSQTSCTHFYDFFFPFSFFNLVFRSHSQTLRQTRLPELLSLIYTDISFALLLPPFLGLRLVVVLGQCVCNASPLLHFSSSCLPSRIRGRGSNHRAFSV